MIVCKELNTEFANDKELFKALRENKNEIIAAKKSQIYKSFEKGIGVKSNKLDVSKLTSASKDLFKDDNYHYIVVNTTGILDSHNDLHVKGCFKKSSKEQNRKNALVDTHEMSLKSTIARRQDVEMFVADIPFSMIGKAYDGETEAFIYKIAKDKIREEYKEFLQDGTDIEGSVRMQYINITLALNSDDDEDKEEKKTFGKFVNQIANKADFDNLTHFWVVSEGKNIGESSLVLQGSNHATGVVNNNKIEPLENTQDKENEAVKDTSHYLL